MFSSEEAERSPHGFDESALADYVRVEEYEKWMDYVQKDMRLEMMHQCREMIEEISTTIVAHAVEDSQVKMVTLLQSQLMEATDKMQEVVDTKTSAVQTTLDRINTSVLPEQRQQIADKLAACEEHIDGALTQLRNSCTEQILLFGERIEAFEVGVATTQVKFKRLASDIDVFRKYVSASSDKVEDMVKVMRAEQLAHTKIISTLMELESIQQSLDFQDEFDKT